MSLVTFDIFLKIYFIHVCVCAGIIYILHELQIPP